MLDGRGRARRGPGENRREFTGVGARSQLRLKASAVCASAPTRTPIAPHKPIHHCQTLSDRLGHTDSSAPVKSGKIPAYARKRSRPERAGRLKPNLRRSTPSRPRTAGSVHTNPPCQRHRAERPPSSALSHPRIRP
ncbi:hypothetical protein PT2222_200021 [Paraburkholderia tropica]